MDKYAAFGAILQFGIQQSEYAIVALTGSAITVSGNATVTVTCTGMTGSPLAVSVAVLQNDTADQVGAKIRTALGLNATIAGLFHVEGSGTVVRLRKKIPAANIANLNIAIADDTCEGIDPVVSSVNERLGQAIASVAGIRSLNGLPLSTDTADVTTHDSPGGFEEVITTIKRTGEISMDIVFDPNDATHDADTGLQAAYDDRVLCYLVLNLVSAGSIMYFEGFVIGLEPSMPVEGALTASCKVKATGAVTLFD